MIELPCLPTPPAPLTPHSRLRRLSPPPPPRAQSFEICNLELKDTYHLNFMVYLGQKASGIGAAVGNAASMAANVVGGTINLATKVGTLGAVSLDRKAKEGELHSGTGGIMGRNQDATTAFALPDEDFGSNFAGRKTVQLMASAPPSRTCTHRQRGASRHPLVSVTARVPPGSPAG